jgi:hypothetical protein
VIGTTLRNTAERIRRRSVLLAKWLPDLPGDVLAARRHTLPAPYRRIWFFHVRKTAGTSLYKSFLGLGGEDPAVVEQRFDPVTHSARSGDYMYLFVGRNRFLTMRSRYFFGYGHGPIWRVSLPADTFTLTILRDPVERVLSLYRYLSDERSDRGERIPAPAQEREWAKDGFRAFIERIPERDLLMQLWMFSPDYDPKEAARAIRALSMYFFTESYNEGVTALSSRLGLALPQRTDRVSLPVDPPRHDEIELLRKRLEPELELVELLRADPGPGLVGRVP